MGRVPSVVHDVLAKRSSLERQIRELAESAEVILDHVQATDSEVTRVENILREIDRELRELVDIKKSTAFFKELLDVAPESQHTVDVLLKDHDKLIVDLSRIREELSRTDHSLTVRKHLHGWIQRFREFDSREITLLQNVWSVDVGAAD